MRLVLLGPPGSGKGTQASAIARHFGIPVISTGELLRAGAAGGGEAGRDVAERLARGELVPDDLVLSLVNQVLETTARHGYILDGFPRTLAQAEHPAAPAVDAVVHLDVPDEVVRQRIALRADAGRTDDADRATVDRRIRRYHAETEPLLQHYRQRGLLETVDGAEEPEDVTAAILRVLRGR